MVCVLPGAKRIRSTAGAVVGVSVGGTGVTVGGTRVGVGSGVGMLVGGPSVGVGSGGDVTVGGKGVGPGELVGVKLGRGVTLWAAQQPDSDTTIITDIRSSRRLFLFLIFSLTASGAILSPSKGARYGCKLGRCTSCKPRSPQIWDCHISANLRQSASLKGSVRNRPISSPLFETLPRLTALPQE